MRKPPGRKKGVPNKLSRETKENLLIAFDRLNGIAGLVDWARDNQTDFYKLWAKTLPMTVGSDPNNPIIPKEIAIRLISGNRTT